MMAQCLAHLHYGEQWSRLSNHVRYMQRLGAMHLSTPAALLLRQEDASCSRGMLGSWVAALLPGIMRDMQSPQQEPSAPAGHCRQGCTVMPSLALPKPTASCQPHAAPTCRALFSADQSFPLAAAFIYSVYQFQQKRIKREPEGPFFLGNPMAGAIITTVINCALACAVSGRQ